MPRYKKFEKKSIKRKSKNNDKISRLDKMKSWRAYQSGRTTRSTSNGSGDANLDGDVNILDVVMIIAHITENMTMSPEQQAEADVIGNDGFINIYDVLTLINITCSNDVNLQFNVINVFCVLRISEQFVLIIN